MPSVTGNQVCILLFLALVSVGLCCPDFWTTYQGSCYYFGYGNYTTFAEAELYCRYQDAHLINVDDKNENTFLKSYMKRLLNADYGYWLGINDDDVEGVWRWNDTDTVATFTDWYPGQPESGNHASNEDCAAMIGYLHMQWGDIVCTHPGLFPACEMMDVGVEGSEIIG